MVQRKYKVLAVDDECDLLLIIKTALMGEGFDVVTASNGPDALALAEDEKPDCILLDVMMPEMNGFEVLQCLRGNEKTERIPVIMLTGVSDKEKIRDALSSGIDYYIVKPFQLHDLVQKVKLAIADSLNPGL
jgi:DNA-binding response OmpR family regulator